MSCCTEGGSLRTYVYDLETTNLRSDIGTLIVASFGELDADGNLKKLQTNDYLSAGGEKNIAKWTYARLVEADILIGHNSLAFDRNFLNGLFTRLKMPRCPQRIQIDTMQTVKGKLNYQSSSLENLADIFRVGSKDKPSKHDWREANLLTPEAIKRLRKRCESDVEITAAVWRNVKPIYFERWGR